MVYTGPVYLQITTRCNMTCAHCGFSCCQNGDDMTRDTFYAALAKFSTCERIIIGGGEPTMHQNFFEFISACNRMGFFEDNLQCTTNGKITHSAERLARLAKQGLILAILSQDKYHDPIEGHVVNMYDKETNPCIFSVGYELADVGRAKKTSLAGRCHPCVESAPLVDPHGIVWTCGCKRSAFGHVTDVCIPADHELHH